ncbi:MAG: histidine phosphatase family protein [Limnohabitans sp.]
MLQNTAKLFIFLLRFYLCIWSIPSIAHVDENVLLAISQPGVIILMRHSETDQGFGDPPGFQIDDCKTQRNLSKKGIAQAYRFGRWLEQKNLRPNKVRSSQWCRCVDTANAAFGNRIKTITWSALNSFFQGHGNLSAQLNEAHDKALEITTAFEVWVTHQVVISALTDSNLATGEFVVVKPQSDGIWRVLGRGRVN